MAYILDLFTPETWKAFCESDRKITGFRQRHYSLAKSRVKSGDIFICYLTRLSRWCGILKVKSGPEVDDSPILDNPDPYVVRFQVEPVVMLEPHFAIPVEEDEVWNTLSITKQYKPGTRGWTGFFRGSLNRFTDEDGAYLERLVIEQGKKQKSYPLSVEDIKKLNTIAKVVTADGIVEVEVPERSDEEPETANALPDIPDARESIQMQAKVAHIGIAMGFRVWVPRSDKARVLELVPETIRSSFLDQLPLNYDETTIKTIEQIDVLWLRGRSMARAFEVEHTTAVYSGLLRMADLLALQPNMDIRLHIVAPDDKRERVLREIKRPVFSLLETGPLYEKCSFISYDSVTKLGEKEHLSYTRDGIIAEFEESAEV